MVISGTTLGTGAYAPFKLVFAGQDVNTVEAFGGAILATRCGTVALDLMASARFTGARHSLACFGGMRPWEAGNSDLSKAGNGDLSKAVCVVDCSRQRTGG